MKKHKKLSLKKQTVANLEKSHLLNVNGGKPVSNTCETISELGTVCGCTVNPSCDATCFGMHTCFLCLGETNPGPE
jgi:hypothetical protein